MKSWYDCDKDVLNVDFGKGDVKAFTSEFLKDITVKHQGKGVYEFVTPDNMWTVNAGDSVNSFFNIGRRNTMNEKMNEGSKQMYSNLNSAFNEYGIVNGAGTIFSPFTQPHSTPTKMKRLTTYNDWTILLENDKLVAVNSTGTTIRAVGSLLSAGGKAWMWKNGCLYSGELSLALTEEQEVRQKREDAKQKVRAKFDKKLEALNTKEANLMSARGKALRSL